MTYIIVAVVVVMTKQSPLMQGGKPEEVVGIWFVFKSLIN